MEQKSIESVIDKGRQGENNGPDWLDYFLNVD